MADAKRKTRVTSSHWGAFKVITEGDAIVAVEPFSADPNPSAISEILPAAVHHDSRIKRPSIRRGWLESRNRDKRGEDEFVELPWDEALDIGAAELDRVRKEHGNEAIYAGSYGWGSAGRFHHAQSQVHRFLNTAGGYVSSFGSYSTGCAQSIMPHVFGMPFLKFTYGSQDSWETIAAHTETLVMFGGINPKNSQVSMGGITEHETADRFKQFAASGMRRINIGPQRTDAPEGCEWLPVKPATDTALMLALAYVIETEGYTDEAFLAEFTTGFERFKPYLLGTSDGQPKSPEWASAICGVSADEISELARYMATTRTLITVSWSLQRGEHGEQPYWMAATLASMLGQIGLAGGGIGFGYGAIGGIGKPLKHLLGMTLPQGVNPVKTFIPVARVADMLLNPGVDYDFNGKREPYPDIKLVYWCGGNPFHHHQDLNRLHEAWKQPETVIVHEPWWTATARRADIVFPATTPYEREDIGLSKIDDYLFNMPQLIPAQHEARDDYEIFAGLAERMGIGDAFTEGRSAEQWLRHLYADFHDNAVKGGVYIPDFDGLREQNWLKLPIRSLEYEKPFLRNYRENPQTSPLPTPSGKIEIFSETIEGFNYDDCAGHAIWLPPQDWLGAATEAMPLHMISPQPGDKLHSQLECALADVEGARPETLIMHPTNAQQRGLQTGDIVKVHNERGSCRARLRVSEDIVEDVVALPTGVWFSDTHKHAKGGQTDGHSKGLDEHGNPNVLTRDVGTSRLGQGSSAHTALVEVSALL
ncbi:molybdopterin-dependent oxidoreductase [Leucothrix pacifica]|uniref:Asp-tRNA(Asn)/Glu-tRNA(Gln) amidotransferase GatCAB subunit C n=1 Tax=Leucothrix pacifica TaxID=1247513 RepID=A0A317CJ94_9GAMM|nr:molybdopterin-dependent oxidoreductase [Leucothrix pacifica]PWQ98635.1 Asp-tRNA(Asn)/Glu-tRNA(Gln) amidotransferase GatCAB subunit C [Leucothrix pacifica]